LLFTPIPRKIHFKRWPVLKRRSLAGIKAPIDNTSLDLQEVAATKVNSSEFRFVGTRTPTSRPLAFDGNLRARLDLRTPDARGDADDCPR
jgi:hypothetical protein